MLPWRSSGVLAEGVLRLTSIMLAILRLFSGCNSVTKNVVGPNTFSLQKIVNSSSKQAAAFLPRAN
jgi:hypothetical protein